MTDENGAAEQSQDKNGSVPPTQGTKAPVVPQEIADRADALMASLQELTASSHRFAERGINFYEKLTVLNAGTLALVFTVTSTLAGEARVRHIPIVDGVGAISAVTLIVLAIFMGLLTGLARGNLATHAELEMHILRLKVESQRLQLRTQALFGERLEIDDMLKPLDTQLSKSQRSMRFLRPWSGITGALALILTLIAFTRLLVFIRLNLHAVM